MEAAVRGRGGVACGLLAVAAALVRARVEPGSLLPQSWHLERLLGPPMCLPASIQALTVLAPIGLLACLASRLTSDWEAGKQAGAASELAAVHSSMSCHVCLGLMVNPVTSSCGHTTCRVCYKQMLLRIDVPKCFCGTPLPPAVPPTNVAMRDIIAAMFPSEVAELESRVRTEETETDDLMNCCGDYKPGDVVVARISRATRSQSGLGQAHRIHRGEEGTVLGPVPGSNRGRELRVNFPHHPSAVVGLEDICHPLPGGFRPGDEVISLIDYIWSEERSLSAGEVGEVLGPAMEAAALDMGRQVLCRFPNNHSVNVFTSQLKQKGVAGGYKVGDQVVVRVASGSLAEGEEGLVLGPAPRREDGAEQIHCGFPGNRDCNVGLSAICLRLPGGFKHGDKVVSLIAFDWPDGKKLDVGDVGEILGPAMRGLALDEGNQVLCKFPLLPSVHVFTSQIRRHLDDRAVCLVSQAD